MGKPNKNRKRKKTIKAQSRVDTRCPICHRWIVGGDTPYDKNEPQGDLLLVTITNLDGTESRTEAHAACVGAAGAYAQLRAQGRAS